ncbi:MAG TPA: DUF922 domain-containing protein [Longimicrobiaceae bacterium]|nr:DUF922 domain-containing protein [Longimicrobiaceae bacterium]
MRIPVEISAAALAVLLAACASGTGRGEPSSVPLPRLEAAYVFYEVSGATAAELEASLLAGGPLVGDSVRYARTAWTVPWSVRSWHLRGQCAVHTVQARLDARVWLPRWRPPPEAPPELVAQWDEFVRALAAHEAGHVRLGAEAVRELRNALRSLSALNCALLEARASTEAARVLERYQRRNDEYDRETAGGGTQGVAWPPAAGRNGTSG